ncbi:type I restriction endonuclease subunit R, partial [Helicobacter pylori]|nr:type I restriction endonuclease subunit R [Helicobacter pylori]
MLMLVDRNELEQQLFSNLASVGLAGAVLAESKRHLRELLRGDYRGLIVTTIHKFEGMEAAINPLRYVFVLVDEAYRSTGVYLCMYLWAVCLCVSVVGFTGTPIDRGSRGRSTFEIFGADDEGGYLDKYSIRESIADGTTVPLHYTLAPNELRVDRETLDREFLSLKEAEGVSDVEELNSVLERAVTLKNMLKNPQRVERVARFVAEHYQDYVKP